MRRIYLDNAATTQVNPDVVQAMLPYFTQIYANPSSVHSFGQDAAKAINEARAKTAKAINAKPEEIIFTSGGTESDNFVLRGVALKNKSKGAHIITTSIEHHAIGHTCEALEKELGCEFTYLPVDEFGLITPEQVAQAIREDTILVSVMFANNEIGTIMPIAQIGSVCREKGVYFHTDAVQAVGHLPIDVEAMCIDFLSLSAHKFHGPKGVGALYARKGTKLANILFGGGQEKGRRPTTENVPGIVGLGKAIELSVAGMEEENEKVLALREKLINGLEDRIDDIRLNGHREKRLNNNVNISIRYVEGESLLLMLDMQGIAASSGSACTSGALDPSHVLLAIGLSHEIAHGSLRLTLSANTTDEDIEYVLDTLPGIVERLRSMSPLYQQKVRG